MGLMGVMCTLIASTADGLTLNSRQYILIIISRGNYCRKFFFALFFRTQINMIIIEHNAMASSVVGTELIKNS